MGKFPTKVKGLKLRIAVVSQLLDRACIAHAQLDTERRKWSANSGKKPVGGCRFFRNAANIPSWDSGRLCFDRLSTSG